MKQYFSYKIQNNKTLVTRVWNLLFWVELATVALFNMLVRATVALFNMLVRAIVALFSTGLVIADSKRDMSELKFNTPAL